MRGIASHRIGAVAIRASKDTASAEVGAVVRREGTSMGAVSSRGRRVCRGMVMAIVASQLCAIPGC